MPYQICVLLTLLGTSASRSLPVLWSLYATIKEKARKSVAMTCINYKVVAEVLATVIYTCIYVPSSPPLFLSEQYNSMKNLFLFEEARELI